MMPTRTRRDALLILPALAAAPGVALAQHGPGVGGVLERMRGATGGARAWNAVRGLHEVGTEGGRPYERWIDFLRWGERVETGVGTAKVIQGYNGYGLWWLPLSTPWPAGTQQELLARARSDAFFGAHGYLFTGRFDMRSSLLGVRPSGGRSFDVVRVHPEFGEPRELWFDRRTGLLGRMVDGRSSQPRTLEFSDYRKAGRLTLPFHVVTTGGGLSQPLERQLEKIEAVAPDRALFSLPREGAPPPPAARPRRP